ncbi:protein of unknown function [Bradyrhizobium vignae]|uniref:Uncharacterized protein n=1 Tax=Bradyrhizobium vignae TaxID=1549949 RepID=A0A2U3Q6P0_9BRAD|nr:protein of unknown function [Bradyrhizobium vignae]
MVVAATFSSPPVLRTRISGALPLRGSLRRRLKFVAFAARSDALGFAAAWAWGADATEPRQRVGHSS